jgi:MFS family permease
MTRSPVQSRTSAQGKTQKLSLEILGVIVAIILYIIAYMMVLRIMSDMEPDIDDMSGAITRSVKIIFPFIWIAIVSSLVQLGGSVLLVIPGIVASVFISQAFYILIVEDVRGIPALLRSWQYVRGRWWQVFGRILVLVLILAIVGLLVVVIISSTGLSPQKIGDKEIIPFPGIVINQLVEVFFVIPFAAAYLYLLYHSLKESKLPEGEEDRQTARTWTTVFLIIGLVVILIAVFVIVFFPTLFILMLVYLQKTGFIQTLPAIISTSTSAVI